MNTKEQVNEWDRILDEYESNIGIPKYKESSFDDKEFEQYFSMNRDVIEKQTPDDCIQISLRLAQYGLHIQRSLNREMARQNWSEELIKQVIADDINNYKGYGYIEKSQQAIKYNEKANSLNKIRTFAKQRVDRLSYIASSIKNLSDIFMSIYKTKVNQKHG
jgi:hypothetical protein